MYHVVVYGVWGLTVYNVCVCGCTVAAAGVKASWNTWFPLVKVLVLFMCIFPPNVALWKYGLAQEAGVATRGCTGYRTEEQQLQDLQVGTVCPTGWCQLHQAWVSNQVTFSVSEHTCIKAVQILFF